MTDWQKALSTHPDLTAVAAAWSMLPPAIRTGILAMVRAAGNRK